MAKSFFKRRIKCDGGSALVFLDISPKGYLEILLPSGEKYKQSCTPTRECLTSRGLTDFLAKAGINHNSFLEWASPIVSKCNKKIGDVATVKKSKELGFGLPRKSAFHVTVNYGPRRRLAE